jgi:sRNA-binding protein
VKQLRERKKRARAERREKKRLAKERHEAEVRERERREQRSGLNGGDSQRSVMKPVSNSSTSGAKKNEVAVRVGVVAGPAVE